MDGAIEQAIGRTLTNCDKYDEGAPDRRRQSRKTELSFTPTTGFDASIIFARSSHWRRKTVASKSKESMMRYLSTHGCGGFMLDIEVIPRDWIWVLNCLIASLASL